MTKTEIRANSGSASLKAKIRAVRLVVFDFDGVFTDNAVYVAENGTEMVRCNRSDGLGLQKLTKTGIAIAVISTETNPVVSARCRKLSLHCVQSCDDKKAALEALIKEKGLSMEQVAFVGNDINDLPCLDIVGLPIIVQDAHPDVADSAAYRTEASGGNGAVREICDMFERVLKEARE